MEEEARKLGIGELFLCRVERFVEDMTDPHPLGFDAAIEFQPDGINLDNSLQDSKYASNSVFKYEDLVKAALLKDTPPYLRFPCVCPNWDNSPRREKNAVIFDHSTPHLYELWLKKTIARTTRLQTDERIIFINAFNEWGEGCHLEPDQKFGRSYLEATRRALILSSYEELNICQNAPQYFDGRAGVTNKNDERPSATVDAEFDNSPLVSIVIPVFNKVEYTMQCIDALIENTPHDLYEVIIVDNGSTDATKEFLACLEGDVKVITNKKNVGFAKACNQGVHVASGEYLLFLNNDTEVQSGWIEPMVSMLEHNQSVAATSCKMLFPDGTIQHAGVMIIDDKKLPDPLVARHIYYGYPSDYPEANLTRTYQALTAACLLVRKSAFREVAGFDEEFWNGYEDIDLCFKLQQKGWLLAYQPKSVIIHHESKSGPERFSGIKHNIERLHHKWLQIIEPDFVINADGSTIQQPSCKIRPYVQLEECKSAGKHRLTSIIMLTFNQLEYTKICLESIARHTPELHELILVDNGSTDGTIEYLKGYAVQNSHIKLIFNENNRGFAAGNNQGIQQAGGDYILLLNNDVVVTEGWLERLISHLEQSPDIGMVGPMSNSVSGPQIVQDVPYGSSLDNMQTYARGFTAGNLGKTTEHMRLVGFCILMKKEVVDVIGGLDENYGSGNFEDDDLCLRSFIAGYKNIIANDVFIHHYGSMTFKGNSIDYMATMKKNFSYFGKKWKDILEINDTGYRIHLTKEKQIQKLICLGEEKYSSGDLRSAIKIFERVLRIDKRNAEALSNLGVIQWQLGKTTSAVDIFQKALFLDPHDHDALANLVQAVEELKRADLVQNNLVDLLRQSQPTNPDFKRLVESQELVLRA